MHALKRLLRPRLLLLLPALLFIYLQDIHDHMEGSSMVASISAPAGAPLSASEVDQVAGGMSVYYSLFYWIGMEIGIGERNRQATIAENPLSEFTYL